MPEQLSNDDPSAMPAGRYDHLLSQSDEVYKAGVAEANKVQEQSTTASQLAEQDAETDAKLRERVPQPPLTDAQVAQLSRSRGTAVTAEQRQGMDEARARGIHTSIV